MTELESKLNAYLDEELTASERDQVDRLISQNPAARALLSELSAARWLLGRLPREKAPAEIYDQIQAHLERGGLLDDLPTWQGEKLSPRRQWPMLLSTAAVAVLSVGLGWVVLWVIAPAAYKRNTPDSIAAATPAANSAQQVQIVTGDGGMMADANQPPDASNTAPNALPTEAPMTMAAAAPNAAMAASPDVAAEASSQSLQSHSSTPAESQSGHTAFYASRKSVSESAANSPISVPAVAQDTSPATPQESVAMSNVSDQPLYAADPTQQQQWAELTQATVRQPINIDLAQLAEPIDLRSSYQLALEAEDQTAAAALFASRLEAKAMEELPLAGNIDFANLPAISPNRTLTASTPAQTESSPGVPFVLPEEGATASGSEAFTQNTAAQTPGSTRAWVLRGVSHAALAQALPTGDRKDAHARADVILVVSQSANPVAKAQSSEAAAPSSPTPAPASAAPISEDAASERTEPAQDVSAEPTTQP